MTNGKNAGFTLIELVIVIVILGVLAAVAAPRFIDLSGDAENSSLRAQASGIESASAINFAAAAARGATDSSDDEVETVDACSEDVAENLVTGDLDAKYTVTDDGGDGFGEFGNRHVCTLNADAAPAGPVEFTLIAVPAPAP